jgi:hypothetical protein
MHPGELTLDPFIWSIEGPRGTVVLRRSRDHADRCVKAIGRRSHPAWSIHSQCGFRVEEPK